MCLLSWRLGLPGCLEGSLAMTNSGGCRAPFGRSQWLLASGEVISRQTMGGIDLLGLTPNLLLNPTALPHELLWLGSE